MDKPKIDFRSKTSPLIASLPEQLKDPANYERIKKAIWETVQTTCTHASIVEMAECKRGCKDKMIERRLLFKRLGFKNPAQYRAWHKIHETIKQKYPLVDWTYKPKKIIT